MSMEPTEKQLNIALHFKLYRYCRVFFKINDVALTRFQYNKTGVVRLYFYKPHGWLCGVTGELLRQLFFYIIGNIFIGLSGRMLK